jgi:hypothetical protein
MKNSTAVRITCVVLSGGVAAVPHLLEHAPPGAVGHTLWSIASSPVSSATATWHEGGTIIPDSMRDAEYDVSAAPLSWLLVRNDK